MFNHVEKFGRVTSQDAVWWVCHDGCVMVGVSWWVCLSRGNFCAVFKCTEKTTDYVYVAKILSIGGGAGAQRVDPMGELDMLRDLVHPRVVTLEDAYHNQDQLILVLEQYVLISAK